MTTLSTTVPERISLPPSRPGAGPDTGPAPSAGDIIAMLRRRLLLIIVLFAVFSAFAVGGFAVWWFHFPGFRADCLIECISNLPETELTLEQDRLRKEEYQRFVETQALLLKSPGILGEALKVTAVRETDWWKSIEARASKAPNEHLIELTEELSATPVRETSLLRVSMVCRERQDPAVIVNEVVRQWHGSVRRRAADDLASEPLEAAQAELEELNRAIEDQRRELQSLAERLPAGARLNPAANITAQDVEQYAQQVAQLSLELAQLEQYRAIYNNPDGVPVTAEDRAAVEADPQVAQFAQYVLQLEQQRAADERIYGPQHSVFKQIDAQVAVANDRLATLRLERLREHQEDMQEATNTAYLNTQHALFLAREKLGRAEAALQDQDQLLFRYANLDAELAEDVEYRLQLGNYVKTLSRVVRRQSAIRVNVAQPAVEPLEQHSPNWLLLPFGFFLALVLSVGVALAREFVDTSVRTSQDIVRHLGIAMLGAIPDVDDEEIAIKQVQTAVLDHPRSMVAEAYRRIRTNLQFTAPAERQRSILITSPRPDDGKTTVASNLAIALAQGNRRVLLVDANFRRPGLHRIFDVNRKQGLSNILVGDGSLDAYVAKTAIPALDILSTGPVPQNPVELLGSAHCRALLQEAANRYDRIIIDVSPVLLASDALVLGPQVDGVVLVVRARENSRGVARRACNLLADVGAHLFGAVLNAAQVVRGGYFREQLRDYYDYQTEPAVPVGQPGLGSVTESAGAKKP